MRAATLEDRGQATTRALAVCLGLALAVTVRWQVFATRELDGVTEGLVFGLTLLAIARLGGLGFSVPSVGAMAAGLATGVALVAISILARWPQLPLVAGHAAPLVPWAAVTILVASGEELILRGVLWRWAAAAGGDVAALLATSLLFALIHVPVYGEGVILLDFGVGLIFGGLRLWFGGPAAPAAAHVLADLATWWL